MAGQGWGRVPQTDEEAVDALLGQREEPPARPRRAGRTIALASFLVLAACGLALTSKREQTPNIDIPSVAEKNGQVAVDPELAALRDRQRSRLQIEGNLEDALRNKAPVRQGSQEPPRTGGPKSCQEHTAKLFEELISQSSFQAELTHEETEAFKQRFVSAMQHSCRDATSEAEWLAHAGRELEEQKPVMTHSLASALNTAGVGFKVSMKQWMVHLSKENYNARLGVLPTAGKESIMKRGRGLDRTTAQLPDSFDSEDKWPKCKDAILRIHNQGHCGSCWAFGTTASLDARTCIATDGQFVSERDTLSRLQAASCAADFKADGWDGCQGGWPVWVLDYMSQNSGLVSSSCIPYYITGEGVEHFSHQDTAPQCNLMTHCQGGYNRTVQQDSFMLPGVQNYDWIADMHGDAQKTLTMMTAMYEEGPVAFVFEANHPFMGYNGGVFSLCSPRDRGNHAVYASGWGSEDGLPYIQASNSWGPGWGVGGRFKIHPNCVVATLIPGTIHDVKLHNVGDVNLNVPRDPTNENWPWKATDVCPFDGRCVTDMGGATGPYTANEECVSHALDGHKIKVDQWAVENNYDVLHANGREFSGDAAVDKLNGLVINKDGIKFKADQSVQLDGFKLCIDDQ